MKPSHGHNERLLHRERETLASVFNERAWLFPRNSESTPAPSPCNIQGIGGSQIRQKPLSGQLRKGNWSYSLFNLSLYNPECLMSVHLGSRREPRWPRVVHPKVAYA